MLKERYDELRNLIQGWSGYGGRLIIKRRCRLNFKYVRLVAASGPQWRRKGSCYQLPPPSGSKWCKPYRRGGWTHDLGHSDNQLPAGCFSFFSWMQLLYVCGDGGWAGTIVCTEAKECMVATWLFFLIGYISCFVLAVMMDVGHST